MGEGLSPLEPGEAPPPGEARELTLSPAWPREKAKEAIKRRR